MYYINCIPVKELYDQHLALEYEGIFSISSMALIMADYGIYNNGGNHLKFFYNKGEYLKNRAEALYAEGRKRGIKLEYQEYKPHLMDLNNDWGPGLQDYKINLDRIRTDIAKKPGFYTNANDRNADNNSKTKIYRKG